MLYDPKWKYQVQLRHRLSLASLIGWLEQQPTNGRYYYLSNRNCLLARYFRSAGLRPAFIGGWSWKSGDTTRRLPMALRMVARAPIDRQHWFGLRDTFGEALERARNLAAKAY
jgi:hypothetical protein